MPATPAHLRGTTAGRGRPEARPPPRCPPRHPARSPAGSAAGPGWYPATARRNPPHCRPARRPAGSRIPRRSLCRMSLTPADIFAPNFGVTLPEFPHDALTTFVVGQHDRDSLLPEELQVAGEGGGLANDHPGYLEQQDRAAAHLARGERGVERHAEVGGLPAGVA